MDWQDYFQKNILKRGFNYYKSGLVTDVSITDTYVSAVVHGSENYDVQIDREDNGDFSPDMYCSCPYADGGNLCKHMAAVLFQAEELLSSEEPNVEKGKEQAVDMHGDSGTNFNSLKRTVRKKEISPIELVHQADEETVRDFLAQILANDEKLAIQFENLLFPAKSTEDIARLKKSLDKLLNHYGDRYGFLDYTEAIGFCEEASRFLSEQVVGLMDSEEYTAAFELSGYTFLKVAAAEMDDSSGCLVDFSDQCSSAWRDIYQQCNADTRDYMFAWCEKHLDGSVVDYMEDEIESFFENCFDEPKYLRKKLAFADNKISGYKGEESNSFSGRYNLSRWVMYKITLMEKLDFSRDEITRVTNQYWFLSRVRMWTAEQAEKENDIDKVIHIYEQSLILDKEFPGLVRDYAVTLKDLYKKSDRMTEYISMLWRLELQYQPGDVHIYRELKQAYSPEEWKIQREIIFNKLSGSTRRDALYYEDGLYDRLLVCCLNNPGLQLIQKYKNDLLKLFPDEVLHKYVDTAEEMAKRTGTRSYYQELVGILRQIRQMPGGKSTVLQITARWREMYKNRPAMMDELRKVNGKSPVPTLEIGNMR